MAYMVAYDDMLIKLAYGLIKEKSNEDDIKAAEDLYALDTILSGVKTCFNPYDVDKRLREDYETIEKLENIQEKFCYNDKRPMKRTITEEERIMNRLESDRIGVIADVLIKHKIIKHVDKIYKPVCG